MAEPSRCPQCGRALEPNLPEGLCPRCLLSQGGADGGTESSARRAPRFEPPPIGELQARFPQFEILELIGQGGMGLVYKARQRSLDRIVALKILPPEAARTPGFAERFEREARALARLNHPSIVSVY